MYSCVRSGGWMGGARSRRLRAPTDAWPANRYLLAIGGGVTKGVMNGVFMACVLRLCRSPG